jgi:hypothetical protein
VRASYSLDYLGFLRNSQVFEKKKKTPEVDVLGGYDQDLIGPHPTAPAALTVVMVVAHCPTRVVKRSFRREPVWVLYILSYHHHGTCSVPLHLSLHLVDFLVSDQSVGTSGVLTDPIFESTRPGGNTVVRRMPLVASEG